MNETFKASQHVTNFINQSSLSEGDARLVEVLNKIVPTLKEKDKKALLLHKEEIYKTILEQKIQAELITEQFMSGTIKHVMFLSYKQSVLDSVLKSTSLESPNVFIKGAKIPGTNEVFSRDALVIPLQVPIEYVHATSTGDVEIKEMEYYYLQKPNIGDAITIPSAGAGADVIQTLKAFKSAGFLLTPAGLPFQDDVLSAMDVIDGDFFLNFFCTFLLSVEFSELTKIARLLKKNHLLNPSLIALETLQRFKVQF
jgi:hypothetical protein